VNYWELVGKAHGQNGASNESQSRPLCAQDVNVVSWFIWQPIKRLAHDTSIFVFVLYWCRFVKSLSSLVSFADFSELECLESITVDINFYSVAA